MCEQQSIRELFIQKTWPECRINSPLFTPVLQWRFKLQVKSEAFSYFERAKKVQTFDTLSLTLTKGFLPFVASQYCLLCFSTNFLKKNPKSMKPEMNISPIWLWDSSLKYGTYKPCFQFYFSHLAVLYQWKEALQSLVPRPFLFLDHLPYSKVCRQTCFKHTPE